MNIVFLMDPLETVKPEKDTTLALMAAATASGDEVYYLSKQGLSVLDADLLLHVTQVKAYLRLEQPFETQGDCLLKGSEIDILFIRTDPPFDGDYLEHTWMLEYLPKEVCVINSPAGLRSVNEKLWALQFQNCVPQTLVSRNIAELKDFVRKHDRAVIKPLNGFGGQGVFVLGPEDANISVALEVLTEGGTKSIVAQEYIAAARKGDKRILLLDGEPLGAVLRVHAEGEHRNNFFAGGRPEAVEITPSDQKIIDHLRPYLKKQGLLFVGIDIIGDKLIEVNVTSPTCLQEMNRLYNKKLEDEVIRFAKERRMQLCQS